MVQSEVVPGLGTWFLSSATMVARFAIAAVLAGVIVLWRSGDFRLTRGEVWQGAGLGFFGGLGMLAQVDGLAHTEASTSAFLTQGTVFFIPVVKAITSRKLPVAREALCCLLALAGIAVLSGFDWRRLHMGRGEWETLVAAMLFTGHILWLERAAFRGNDSLKASVVMFATIAVLCLPLLWVTGGGAREATVLFKPVASWWLLAVLVGPCTLMAFLWMNRWQPHVSAMTAGLIYCFEPVFASVLALFLPVWIGQMAGVGYANEALTTTLLLGGGLILIANVLMQWPAHTGGVMNEHGS